MNKMHVASIIFLITLSLLIIPQTSASNDPSVHFDSSPTTTWYNQTPYKYVAIISSPYNWTLNTDATLHISDANVASDTASQTIFGILSTGSYWVNISISYHNSTGKITLLTYQNYTLTIMNKPFIYSTPETFFYPDSTYNYTYEINQGSITGYSSGMSLNKTSHTLSEYLTGTSYSFFIKVSDKNGTFTQDWGVSSNDLSIMTFDALIGSGIVNVTAPITGIGVNYTTIFLNGKPVFMSIGLENSYYLDIVNNTFYVIRTNSNTAQNATIYFNSLTPGTIYQLYFIFNNKSFTQYMETLKVPIDGTLFFNYVPSAIKSDPVIELIPITIHAKTITLQKSYKEVFGIVFGLMFIIILIYIIVCHTRDGENDHARRKI